MFSPVWFGTRSMITAIPRSWNARTRAWNCARSAPGSAPRDAVAALDGEGVRRAVAPLVVLAVDPHRPREGVVGEHGLRQASSG